VLVFVENGTIFIIRKSFALFWQHRRHRSRLTTVALCLDFMLFKPSKNLILSSFHGQSGFNQWLKAIPLHITALVWVWNVLAHVVTWQWRRYLV